MVSISPWSPMVLEAVPMDDRWDINPPPRRSKWHLVGRLGSAPRTSGSGRSAAPTALWTTCDAVRRPRDPGGERLTRRPERDSWTSGADSLKSEVRLVPLRSAVKANRERRSNVMIWCHRHRGSRRQRAVPDWVGGGAERRGSRASRLDPAGRPVAVGFRRLRTASAENRAVPEGTTVERRREVRGRRTDLPCPPRRRRRRSPPAA
jgi:hypothetical protein